jgi:hypothetical protein
LKDKYIKVALKRLTKTQLL